MSKIPTLMKEIGYSIKVQCDNKLNEYAIYNMFLSRFASAVASKNILTDSCRHSARKPLAYYGLNFLGSGGNKDKPFTIIKNLFSWLESEYYYANRKLKDDYIAEKSKNIKKKDYDNELARIEEESNKLAILKTRINGATSQKIYQISKTISECQFGSLYFYDTEFINKFNKSYKSGNYDDTLGLIYNLYEGDVDCTDTTLTDRSTLENISCSVCFASDFGKLIRDKKLNNNFKEYLSGGFARRTYIYCDREANLYKAIANYPSLDEKILEREKLETYTSILKGIYDQILPNTTYKYSYEANKFIEDYNLKLQQRLIDEFSYSDILPLEDEIMRADLNASTWKIIKTSFIFHLMLYPNQQTVEIEPIQMAIDFYNDFYNFLPLLLDRKTLDDSDKFKIFVYKNLDKELELNKDIKAIFKEQVKQWKSFKSDVLPDLIAELEIENIYHTLRNERKKEFITFYRREN